MLLLRIAPPPPRPQLKKRELCETKVVLVIKIISQLVFASLSHQQHGRWTVKPLTSITAMGSAFACRDFEPGTC